MAIVGYARVSTRDQDLSAQLEMLRAAGATTIYKEKVSGVRADRPSLAKMMAALKPGDIVTVTKLGRLRLSHCFTFSGDEASLRSPASTSRISANS
jgi:DNA invertase Pin-like site-specific DNA recombinase